MRPQRQTPPKPLSSKPVASKKPVAKKPAAKNADTPVVPKGSHVVEPEELWPDESLILAFTIPGQPATKKTSQRIFRRRILPSKQYCVYEEHAKPYCEAAWKDTGRTPMDYGLGITMRVYLHTWTVGDFMGYIQSIADIIQKWGVIENDSWLHSLHKPGEHWFCGIDKDNPRVEIELYRYRHRKEEYRAAQEAEEVAKAERIRVRAIKAAEKAEKVAQKLAVKNASQTAQDTQSAPAAKFV